MDIKEDSEDDDNFITIKYKIEKGDYKIKIFGEKFSNRYNKNNICFLFAKIKNMN